ncbi:hypothetical protein A1O7_00302 [Cladophialophora yegresii CBS 114405]|uniref:Myb-like domain-containing protein n=1 Tax=Cladophialophora yegresii CBS 114405 TaxID=1182544 RepID=W9W786_9EURO|nr:uncharacterized protein A1O7_00302 [Cladophialophora yegresii CBS 114405]EXJ63967.1 hypothetical protein A1O7_00302 [Cladophialophora yegresii CBS 114405]
MDLDDSPDESDDQGHVSRDEDQLHAEDRSLDGNERAREHEHAHSHALETRPKARPDISRSVSFPQRKWKRLRKHYHDHYLDLFKNTFEAGEDDYFHGELPPTQLGATLWQPGEKAKLYHALCRKGRHDLPALAGLVGSKSVVEIKAYLDNLRELEADRQRFEAQPKNVAHAEIPAAIEVGPDCEAILNRAADALLAFQEQYDAVAAKEANGPWLIDHEVAVELDKRADETEMQPNGHDLVSDDDLSSLSQQACSFFHLSAFLELSERLFMNRGSDSPNSWQNIAEDGERPSVTLDCVTLLYDIIVNLLRRLVQSCIFLAQSRLRASTTTEYRPSGSVKLEDVAAALDVLGVKRNARSYWVGLGRSNGLRIVDDAHRRGVDGKNAIPYSEVEESLSQSGRSRSVSAAPGAFSGEEEATSESSQPRESEDSSSDHSNGEEKEDDMQGSEDETTRQQEGDEDFTHGTQTGDDVSESEGRSEVPTPRLKRSRHLDEQQDEYLERMDTAARRKEESRLLFLLGAEVHEKVKEEDVIDLGVRPPQLRKSVEDCMGWSHVNFEAEWESLAKRPRLNSLLE